MNNYNVEKVKENITKTLDELVCDYNYTRSDLKLIYNNAELIYDYALTKAIYQDADKGNLLMIVHNNYLMRVLHGSIFKKNIGERYKLYNLNRGEVQYYYEVMFTNKKIKTGS